MKQEALYVSMGSSQLANTLIEAVEYLQDLPWLWKAEIIGYNMLTGYNMLRSIYESNLRKVIEDIKRGLAV